MNNQYLVPDFVQELLSVSSQGINAIVEKLSCLLSVNVYITDPLFQLQLSSDHTYSIQDSNVIEMKDREYLAHDIFTCEISLHTDYHSGLAAPIVHDDHKIGFIFLLSPDQNAELTKYHQVLYLVAGLCAVHMQKKIEVMQEKSKFKQTFLFNLLYGNMKQKEDIVEYGEIWGWDFSIPHVAIVFSITDSSHFSIDKPILNTLLLTIEKALIQKNIKPITLARQNQVISLLPVPSSDVQMIKKQIEDFTTSTLTQTKTILSDSTIACGVGKIYQNPVNLFRSYQEAKVAFDLGLLLNIPLPFFSDLGLERILYKHDLQDLKEYYENTLADLHNYDLANGMNLLETLEAFATNQFDMSKTAKILFLHRNTLRYRLKKVEEILNIKLDDINKRLDITAAFKIKLLRKF